MIKFEDIRLQDAYVSQLLIKALVPYKIDKQHDQKIRQISLIGCNLNDAGVEILINALEKDNVLQYLNLSKNLLTLRAAKCISKFVGEFASSSRELEHLILDENDIQNTGLNELTSQLVQRMN